MVKVMYKHQPGDPDTTEWRGHTFKSGEAIDLDGRVTANKELIEAARENPFFEVDGGSDTKKPASDNGGVSGGESGGQETPEQYRAYALGWIKTAKSSRALEGQWEAEKPRRDKAGWGTDDQALIDPILQPKIETLKTAERQD